MKIDLIITETNPQRLAQHLLEDFFRAIQHCLQASSRINIALPGGRSIIPFIEALRLSAVRKSIDWLNIHFYLTDERINCDKLETNAFLLRPYLNFVNDSNLHFDLEKHHSQLNIENLSFDIVILGVGEDGHIASIFPHNNKAIKSKATYTVIDNSPKPPAQRITLTINSITSSYVCFVLLVGEGKREALKNLFLDHISPADCPVKRLTIRQHANTRLYTDLLLCADFPDT